MHFPINRKGSIMNTPKELYISHISEIYTIIILIQIC